VAVLEAPLLLPAAVSSGSSRRRSSLYVSLYVSKLRGLLRKEPSSATSTLNEAITLGFLYVPAVSSDAQKELINRSTLPISLLLFAWINTEDSLDQSSWHSSL
jgi:hypothetical protein